jgi:translocation and assembly module TamB
LIWRQFTLLLAKYVAIALITLSLLLTTPWGTQLTLAIFNNVDSLSFDYQSGSLVKGLELNEFKLQLDNLELDLTGFSATLDFSCVIKKTLCIKSVKAKTFNLHYQKRKNTNIEKQHDDKEIEQSNGQKSTHSLFEMPFAIEADSVVLVKSYLDINGIEISIDYLNTAVDINKSEFNILPASSKQLTVLLAPSEENKTTSLHNTLVNLPEINLPIALNIQELKVDDIVFERKTKQENNIPYWHSSNNQLNGTWVHTDVSISRFQTSTDDFSINQLAIKADLTPPYKLNTQFKTQINEMQFWPEIANTKQKISIKGSLENLAYEVTSEGNLALTSKGKVNLVHPQFPFELTLAADRFPMPLSLAEYAKPSSLSLTLRGDAKEQSIMLSSQLKSYGYHNAKVDLTATHTNGVFNVAELLFDDKTTKSHLALNGTLKLKPDDFAWKVSAQSTGFTLPLINKDGLSVLTQHQEQLASLNTNIPNTFSGRLQGDINSAGSWSKEKWSVSINDTAITGRINHAELNIVGDIGVNDTGKLQQGKILLALNGSELNIETAANNYWDIKGKLSIDKLNEWHKEIHGNLISDFSVSGKKDNPVIELSSQINKLSWQQWMSSTLELNGSYQPMNDHQIQLTLSNEKLKQVQENKVLTLDDFILNVTGNATNHKIKTDWVGDLGGTLALTGHLSNDFTHWQSSINQGVFRYKNVSLENDKNIDLSIDLTKKQAIISDHCWLDKGTRICLPEEAVLGDSGDIAIKLSVDLAEIDELILPNDIELISQINGDINAKWSPNKPLNASAKIALSSGHIKVNNDFNQHQLSQWSQGQLAFYLDGQQLTSKLQLTDTQDKNLILINSAMQFIDDFSIENYPINASVQLNQLNLQPFQAVLANIVDLQGNVTANINVDGTLSEPLINGDIALDEGKLLLAQNPNTFDNISTDIAIKNNQAKIHGSFYLEEEKAKIVGDMAWQDGLTLNADLTADSLPLVFPPQVIMNIAPNLNFSLKNKALLISGNIDVLDGNYNIERLPEGSISLSDDVIIIDQHGETIAKKSTSFDVQTNIKVNIDKKFTIKGQGLDSQLLGELQISQQTKQPLQLFGRIQSHEGVFKAYGQTLQIEKGEITFNGPINNPYFNLRATRHIKAQDIDVGVQVTGLGDKLDMKLFSSPTMEVPEMLSYLVRGRSLDTGAENSSAAASLLVGFGVNNSLGLFDEIEKVSFINNIAIDTEGEAEKTQATVSGYLGKRIYLKYGIGVYEPINELTVRLYILNRFWLEVVSGVEKSTDLYYSFDIE